MALPGDCPAKQSSTWDFLRKKGAGGGKKKTFGGSRLSLNVVLSKILTSQTQPPSRLQTPNGLTISMIDQESNHKWLASWRNPPCAMCDVAHRLQTTSKKNSTQVGGQLWILGLFHRFDVLQVGPPRNIERTLRWHGRMDANKDLQDNRMQNMAWNVRKTPAYYCAWLPWIGRPKHSYSMPAKILPLKRCSFMGYGCYRSWFLVFDGKWFAASYPFI